MSVNPSLNNIPEFETPKKSLGKRQLESPDVTDRIVQSSIRRCIPESGQAEAEAIWSKITNSLDKNAILNDEKRRNDEINEFLKLEDEYLNK